MDELITIARPDEEPQLPRASRERFQPLRIGIVNVWQYDYQEWWLENGWMLLHGDNSAGKTKVLELTLPFLLDGQMRSERLDPWGEQGRTMRWNLLEDRTYQQRTGYTWIEFGRRDREEHEAYVTIGACLRASETASRAEASFFVTCKRVGEELRLPRPAEAPLSKDALKRQVGDLYETVHEYQAAVDAALFGFGVDRYRDMINLLLQLRRPKLSSSLKPSGITRLLTESLPPVDEARITDLANMFEQLDGYQARKKELSRSLDALDDYLRFHRTFVRRQLRKAAEALRQANTEVEGDAEKLGEARRGLVGARDQVARLQKVQVGARTTKAEQEGKLEALRSSSEMKAAERLESARQRAGEAKGRWDDANEKLEEREKELAEAERLTAIEETEHRAIEPEYRQLLARTRSAAGEADLLALFEEAVEELFDDVETGRRDLTALALTRRTQVTEVRNLQEEVTRAEVALRKAEERVQNVDGEKDAATAALREAEGHLEEARERLAGEIAAWANAVEQLSLDEDQLSELTEAAVLRVESGSAVRRLLAGHEQHRATVLAGDLASAKAVLHATELQIKAVDAARERLLAQKEVEPAAPATRTASRLDRPGAPLYRLVDFDEALTAPERAGLEAALESAGMLDAWVSPEGELLDPDTFDSFLIAGQTVDGPTLASALRPVSGGEVAENVVDRTLGHIALGRSTSESWVSTDGSWGLGVLTGRGDKAEAQFVGAAARERFRQRQLEELVTQRRRLETDQAEASRALAAVERAREALTEDVQRFPGDTRVADQEGSLHRATLVLAQTERALAAARTAEDDARGARGAAVSLRDERARQLDLTAHLSDLDGLWERIDRYREAAFGLGLGAFKLQEARNRLRREVGNRDRLRELVGNNREQAQSRHRAWIRVQAEADELAGSPVGLAAREALARAAELRESLKALDSSMELREEEIRESSKRVGAAEGLVGQLDSKHGQSVVQRESAAADLVSLVAEGAIGAGIDTDVDVSGEWSMTRALELARQRIEPALAGEHITPQSMDNARNRLFEAFRELTLMLHAYTPSLEWHLDGRFPATTAVYNDRGVSIAELQERIRAERDDQEELFTRGETELIERYLLGEVADHLRERVMSAEGQIRAINEMMKSHRTSSGMYLSLRWSRSVDDARHQDALRSLMSDPSLLKEGERRSLRDFFQNRIRGARDQSDNRTWREHLLAALDYRQWFRLAILKHQDGRADVFTDREFIVGSGGEKAVSLHQPLFAAAAAYYDSAGRVAPRLVMLDEVFVGIDGPTRGGCLDMIGQFDLDLVMTSAEELGIHAEVKALAIYHMVRDHTIRGVLCEHWIWNGHELREVPEG